jgi:hypothetical protein
MFNTNLWIENNHMKCFSHMVFLCFQIFTLLQKQIEVSIANSMKKKNHQLFFKSQFFIYDSSRKQQIYKDVFKKSFHILLIEKFD